MNKKPLLFAFAISLFGHCLFLFIAGWTVRSSQPKELRNISIEIEIEKKPKVASHQSPVTREKRIEKRRKRKKREKKKVKKQKISKTQKLVKIRPQAKKKGVAEITKRKRKKDYGFQVKEQKAEKKRGKEVKEVSEESLKQFQVSASIAKANKRMLCYQDRVKQKIESCRRYPRWAEKQGFEGTVYLSFIILSNGETQDVKIIYPSEFAILNKEAIATVQRASPFLPIPQDTKRSRIKMQVAIIFELQ